MGFKAALSGSVRRYTTVLSRIQFAAREGDRIALIGLNGAGKSTLLRVLNGAFAPTRGSVERRGTMQSLLNATLGFSEYASVTENIILRGTAMGLRRRQLLHALGDILDFSGLRERANYRLHALSSGQRMRLGFAISTCVQPDILLMDEWIATGDAAFMERARSRLEDRFNHSRIVVLASHGIELHKRVCNKALVLDNGKMRYFGGIEEGIETYRDIVSRVGTELQAQVRASDPLLFGHATGVVERVRIVESGIELEGWATDDRGGEVGMVLVEASGVREMLKPERVDRLDVRLHLAKKSGRYGFRVTMLRPTCFDPDGFISTLRVSAGRLAGKTGAPLPLANAALIEMNWDR
ncbi:ABC transporter ATP-binding protein [Lysobacter capsici]|uniref:ABC transporter ATP-binding protein n=1 Tax=Lysobacter capsici TaxID=435897 RepID=UPI003CCD757B